MPRRLTLGRSSGDAIRLALVLALALGTAGGSRALPAFPSAEGYGAAARGGRGGTVYVVKSLADYSPGERPLVGTLRYAIEHRAPDPEAADPEARIVVFAIGGTIVLEREIVIEIPRLTIAGQTAPGDGILLRNRHDVALPISTPLVIGAGDVVIRHLQVRPGIRAGQTHGSMGAVLIGRDDGVEVRDVILDHLSASWATDQLISTWGDTRDVTIQWSIFSEALDAGHPTATESLGSLFGSVGARRLSAHHNLFAHNGRRNPQVVTSGLFEFVNNVVYNWSSQPAVVKDKLVPAGSQLALNFVGNFFIPGAARGLPGDSSPLSPELELRPPVRGYVLFLDGNVTPTLGLDPDARPQSAILKLKDASDPLVRLAPSPRGDAPLAASSAGEAFQRIMTNAGARPGARNPIDARVLDELACGYVAFVLHGGGPPSGLGCSRGRIIDNQDEVLPAGWPALLHTPRPPDYDVDEDGMADDWERAQGFDPRDRRDGDDDADRDGYTNVEEFLNGTSP